MRAERINEINEITVGVGKGGASKLAGITESVQAGMVQLLDVCFDLDNPLQFSKIKPALYHLINMHEGSTSIFFINLPYCIMPDAEEHIMNPPSDKKEKSEGCDGCRFSGFCGGFPKHSSESPQKVADRPKQVCIELTGECNLDCAFCFSGSRDAGFMDPDIVRSIIAQAKEVGTEIVRFTGGEPLLDPNLPNYIKYAKSAGLKVWINSNATLTDRFTEDVIRGSDSILMPIHHHTNAGESKITGMDDSLKRKMETLRSIRKLRPEMTVRTGTTISESNKDSLLDIFRLTKNRLGLAAEFYRLIDTGTKEAGRANLEAFFNDAMKFYKEYGKRCTIANAVPFCISDIKTARLFALGGFMDDGRDRLVVDAKGNVKPTYYSKDVIGTWKDVNAAWNSDTMVKLRGMEYMPSACADCSMRFICRGGGRVMAKNARGDYCANDPLLG